MRTPLLLLVSYLLLLPHADSVAESEKPLITADFQNQTTYIKSDNLVLKANQRIFTYEGAVEVTQEDMILTCETLVGNYDENNQIISLQANTNVVIVQGEGVRASSNKAVYDRETETLELTENPELEQNGSILTADKITLFLKEDRSTAEGAVRVRLIEEKGQSLNLKQGL